MPKYHLRRSEKAVKEQAELVDIIKKCKWMTMALCSGNRPYAVAINYGYDAEKHCLYMHCANDGYKLDVIRHNNACCASIVDDHGYIDGDCDHAYRSLHAYGTVTQVLDKAEIRHALKVMIEHLEPDPKPVMDRFFKTGNEDHVVGILRLDIRHLTGKVSL